MDRLTDVLTNFFVTHKTTTYTEKDESQIHESEILDLQTTNIKLTEKEYTKQSILLKHNSTESQSTSIDKQSEINKSTRQIETSESSKSGSSESSNSESSESSKSESSESSKSESSESSKSESSESSKSNSSESSVLSDLLTDSTILSKTVGIQDNEKKETLLEKVNSVKDKSDNLDTELKKYILKPLEFYKKNIMIVNENKKDNIDILSNLLYKLNLMKDINKLYDNNVHIMTQNDNKKIYKKILLDNPYLYFTNFDFKEEISKKFLEDLDQLEKKTIYIIDTNISCENDNIIKLLSNNKNIHVILILNMNNDNFVDTYKLLGEDKLLIHKLHKLKNMQKQFYKLLLKPICSINFSNFDEYYEALNNEDLDVKYIIFKNTELRYN